MESSLTCPHDRDLTNKWKPSMGTPPLTEKEGDEAVKELNNKMYMFPRVERRFNDPPLNMQNIVLVSFIPAKGALPDKHGIYGFAKIRGTFSSEYEAEERAEYLIRNVDSYHTIYHARVGCPIPMTEKQNYSASHKEIDVKQQMEESISKSVKSKKEDEARQISEIKKQEEELLADVSKKELDPYDKYTELRTKKAQVSWAYLDTIKKLEEMKNIIIKTRKEIEEMEKVDEEYKKVYYKKFIDSRERAGIPNPLPNENENTNSNFIKYMVEEAPLGF